MIVFNTTFHVEASIEQEFIDYMLQIYIPACTQSGILTLPRLARVHGEEEGEGLSFAMEFTTTDILSLEEWNQNESNDIYPPLLNTIKEKIIELLNLTK